jgi:hypothetical protein
MAKAVRGLPEDFALDLPEDKPVVIGDFLDEAPVFPVTRPKPVQPAVTERLKPELVRADKVGEEAPLRAEAPRPLARAAQAPAVIRYQLNLSPRSKKMLEDLVEYVCTYSPENDARTSEVFQGIITLLHNAMDELELSELCGVLGDRSPPRTSRWRSAKPSRQQSYEQPGSGDGSPPSLH